MSKAWILYNALFFCFDLWRGASAIISSPHKSEPLLYLQLINYNDASTIHASTVVVSLNTGIKYTDSLEKMT